METETLRLSALPNLVMYLSHLDHMRKKTVDLIYIRVLLKQLKSVLNKKDIGRSHQYGSSQTAIKLNLDPYPTLLSSNKFYTMNSKKRFISCGAAD